MFVGHTAVALAAKSRAPKIPLVWFVVATSLIEGALFPLGIVLYIPATRAVDRIGSWGFWSFIVVSTVMWASGPWSTSPPSPQFLAWFGLGVYLLVAWAGWVDRHRSRKASG
jgi:hypothetical protein